MNSTSIARASNALFLRRGIAVIGTLLISGTVALGMAGRTSLNIVPEAAPQASLTAAQERFAAFKDAQAMRVMDAAVGNAAASAAPVANEQYAALKDAQLELRDATFVPAPIQDAGR